MTKGNFTLPGEAGYEALTLKMAEKWGADVIRDSDGTKLSEDITKAGYGIYSTICIIRADNEWAKLNMDKLQQSFLMSQPVMAENDCVVVEPLKGFFREQFAINKNDDPKEFWQVFDRTEGEEVFSWEFDANSETVRINNAIPFHFYTVTFLAYRIWEEISMYNHLTNDWGDKEHLLAVEPRFPEVQEHMIKWLTNWCENNPDTTVVRFTSMFYNFAWLWSDDPQNRSVFGDWGSYEMTPSPIALREFEKEYGYKMTGEDFVRAGEYNPGHNIPSKKYRDWMDFINKFVVEFGKKLVDIVHKYGKQAYVFYDDSWIGIEPYGERFKEFGFDGLIRCVFNGFEARLCAGCESVKTHELRLHPYLFPTGLAGGPTFAPGGKPELEASRFWVDIRRALLRKPVDRIGLGGYLHLVEPFPAFCDYIEKVADEFRLLKSYNDACEPYTIKGKVVVLTAWGKLRAWICSGHLHNCQTVDLNNIIESLSGLPVDVDFMSFDDVIEHGIGKDVKVIINAGCYDSAWSGGEYWKNADLKAKIAEFVANGGGLLGVNEPTAYAANGMYFQLTDLFGVERDTGTKQCYRKIQYKVEENPSILAQTKDIDILPLEGVFVKTYSVKVLAEKNGLPTLTENAFGKGKAMYMSSFRVSRKATRLLFNVLMHLNNTEDQTDYICSNFNTECAYYPEIDRIVVINNSDVEQETSIKTKNGTVTLKLKPFDIVVK